MLERHWRRADGIAITKLTPEEHQVFAIRPLVKLFGDSFSKLRAGSKMAWIYALILESAHCLSPRASFSDTEGYRLLKPHLDRWIASGETLAERYRHTLKRIIDPTLSPEERIADLPKNLELTALREAMASACGRCATSIVLVIDRLDEGYEPDIVGTGIIDGLVQAAIDLNTRIPQIKPVVFLRDNIFRAVQAEDPDYSRNIEGRILRLHWDEESLFRFTGKRLARAFKIDAESSLKIWNRCVGGDLKGREGFSRCLQLTLYRPRDVLGLLNEAFYVASKRGQREIMLEHLESTAKTFSQNRLDDLKKEYQWIVPGLRHYIGIFADANPEYSVGDIVGRIEQLLAAGSSDPLVQQDFLILEDAQCVLRALYSVGFIGIRDKGSGNFVFCHDGRPPDREFSAVDRVLVHPCYWMALNCSRCSLNPEQAEEIYDEYDIEVSSETPGIRNNRIKALMSGLNIIPEGSEGASDFEQWCHKAIRICFAKSLRNVQLKANKKAKSQRDIVATNLGEGGAWRRVYEDYGSRQVLFEVKNFKGLESADYHQVLSYLTGDYGKLAFVITRDETIDLYAKKDVEWVRDLYAQHRILVVKLTGQYLSKLLDKLRNPQKHDAVNDAIHKVLDTYTRLYIAGQTDTKDSGCVGKKKSKKQGKIAKATPG
ncbi:MAG: ATP-binding protein [Gammaproteobacteria bacterium]